LFEFIHPNFNILLLLIGALAVVYVIINDSEISSTKPFLISLVLLLIFSIYASIGMVWSPSYSYGTHKIVRLSSVCVLIFVISGLVAEQQKRMNRLIRILYAISIIYSLSAIAGPLIFEVSPWVLMGFNDHIFLGRMIGLGFIISVFLSITENTFEKEIFFYATSIIIFIGLIYSESRQSLIGSIISIGILLLFMIFYYTDRKHSNRSRYILLLSSTAAGVASLTMLTQIMSLPTIRNITPILRGNFGYSFDIRIEYWNSALELWRLNPILGGGSGSFAVYITGNDIHAWPHNIFLEILAEFGILGSLLFLSFLLYPIVYLNFKRDYSRSIFLMSLLIYVVFVASLTGDIESNRILYFITGIFFNNYIFSEKVKLIPPKVTQASN
jgi:O-antigen ligase